MKEKILEKETIGGKRKKNWTTANLSGEFRRKSSHQRCFIMSNMSGRVFWVRPTPGFITITTFIWFPFICFYLKKSFLPLSLLVFFSLFFTQTCVMWFILIQLTCISGPLMFFCPADRCVFAATLQQVHDKLPSISYCGNDLYTAKRSNIFINCAHKERLL